MTAAPVNNSKLSKIKFSSTKMTQVFGLIYQTLIPRGRAVSASNSRRVTLIHSVHYLHHHKQDCNCDQESTSLHSGQAQKHSASPSKCPKVVGADYSSYTLTKKDKCIPPRSWGSGSHI
ncbi:hypothetical protein BsWGS_06547 [Bradybaena similaris]